jgi:hypothetical protein
MSTFIDPHLYLDTDLTFRIPFNVGVKVEPDATRDPALAQDTSAYNFCKHRIVPEVFRESEIRERNHLCPEMIRLTSRKTCDNKSAAIYFRFGL